MKIKLFVTTMLASLLLTSCLFDSDSKSDSKSNDSSGGGVVVGTGIDIILTDVIVSSDSIELKWDDPGDPVFKDISVKIDNGMTSTSSTIDKDIESCTIDSLNENTEYIITMEANFTDSTTSDNVVLNLFTTHTGDTNINFTLIRTPEELNSIRDDLSGSYLLLNDIDLSVYYATKDWNPIGHMTTPFTGIFNGNFHTLKKFNINFSLLSYAGFFAKIENANISNLNIEVGSIICKSVVGALSGMASNSIIKNISINKGISGKITCTGNDIGGLIGSSNSYVENCYSTLDISSNGDDIGGLFGSASGEIFNCYSTGNVEGEEDTAGFVGYNTAEIEACYSTGNVTGVSKTGGFVGYNSGSISYCYTTSNVTSTGNYTGGFASYNMKNIFYCYSSGIITSTGTKCAGFAAFKYDATASFLSSYWDITKNPSLYDIGDSDDISNITGLTTNQMKDETNVATNYIYWNFSEIWNIDNTSNNGLPFLILGNKIGTKSLILKDVTVSSNSIELNWNDPSTTVFENVEIVFNDGTTTDTTYINKQIETKQFISLDENKDYIITIEPKFSDSTTSESIVLNLTTTTSGDSDLDYKLIRTPEEFAKLQENTNLTFDYILLKDISLANYQLGEGWKPIGSDNLHSYRGHFNGNKHTISNLKINNTALTKYIGLFGYVKDGSISNLIISNANITATGDNVAGLCGYLTNSEIKNCSFSGTVEGTEQVGAIAGTNYTSVTSNCHSNGSINGDIAIGGLVGSNSQNSNIYSCYSTCSVTGTNTIGGLVGSNQNSSQISYSYSTGAVTSSDNNAGGIAGINWSSILNCYSTSDVEGNTYVGGITGTNVDTITNCFTTGNIISHISTAGDNLTGGIAGSNTGTVTFCYSISTVIGVQYKGGLIGWNYAGTLTNSCWNTSICSLGVGVGSATTDITGLITSEMKDAANVSTNYSGWDFATVWNIDGITNDGYPFLRNMP